MIDVFIFCLFISFISFFPFLSLSLRCHGSHQISRLVSSRLGSVQFGSSRSNRVESSRVKQDGKADYLLYCIWLTYLMFFFLFFFFLWLEINSPASFSHLYTRPPSPHPPEKEKGGGVR